MPLVAATSAYVTVLIPGRGAFPKSSRADSSALSVAFVPDEVAAELLAVGIEDERDRCLDSWFQSGSECFLQRAEDFVLQIVEIHQSHR